MATMYPMKVEEQAQCGEQSVYEELRKLPEDWVVFHDCWQHYRRGREYVNYEADFIVLVPKLGIVCIEVKDWAVPVRIEQGEWQHLHHGEWRGMGRKRSPLNQAFLASKELAKGLRRRGIFTPYGRYEVRCLAVLLNQVPPGMEKPIREDAAIIRQAGDPAVETLYVCGREALCHGLRERLESLFVYNNDSMTPELMRAVVSFLAPSLLFKLDIAGYTEVMERAAAPIARLLPMLDMSRGGILVEGCAGSGKTVMACTEAARLAARFEAAGSDERILLLCFNRQLAAALAASPQLAPYTQGETPRMDISTLHAFAIDRYLKPLGLEQLLNSTGNGDILTAEAVRAVAQQLHPSYAAVFVDEAQDFRRDWWDDIILRVLQPGGRLRVFADANQNLFRRGNELPDLPTRVTLSTNLRNVRQIAAFSTVLLPAELRMEMLPLSGPAVAIAPGSNDPAERAATVAAMMESIRRQFHTRPCEMVVLSPWRTANPRCSLSLVPGLDAPPPKREEAEAALARHRRCRELGAEQSLGDTIRSFKGLEAPFVILTDLPGTDEGSHSYFSLNDLYVACTRARYGLVIVPTVDAEEEIRRYLSESTPLILPD